MTGDITLDWNLARLASDNDSSFRWDPRDTARVYCRRGGAALLADVIAAVCARPPADGAPACAALVAGPETELPALVTGLAEVGAWLPGQLVVHTAPGSGTVVLAPAAAAGAIPLAISPAMAFTGTSLDLTRLRSAYCAVTGPGPVLPSPRQSQANFDAARAATLLGRGTSPAEICAAIRYILAAPALTGQMLALDGGEHLNWRPSAPDSVAE